MKITRIGMYPTDCHSEEGEFENNIVCTHRNKCAPRLKGAAISTVVVFETICLTEVRDIINLQN